MTSGFLMSGVKSSDRRSGTFWFPKGPCAGSYAMVREQPGGPVEITFTPIYAQGFYRNVAFDAVREEFGSTFEAEVRKLVDLGGVPVEIEEVGPAATYFGSYRYVPEPDLGAPMSLVPMPITLIDFESLVDFLLEVFEYKVTVKQRHAPGSRLSFWRLRRALSKWRSTSDLLDALMLNGKTFALVPTAAEVFNVNEVSLGYCLTEKDLSALASRPISSSAVTQQEVRTLTESVSNITVGESVNSTRKQAIRAVKRALKPSLTRLMVHTLNEHHFALILIPVDKKTFFVQRDLL
jgi:hypothetical protein